MAVDLTTIQALQAEIQALTQSVASTPPGPAQDVIHAQIAGLNAQLTSAINNAQQQSNAWSNIMSGLSIFSAMNSLGGVASLPSIINIFRR